MRQKRELVEGNQGNKFGIRGGRKRAPGLLGWVNNVCEQGDEV